MSSKEYINLLVVDDKEENLSLISRFFEDSKFNVKTFSIAEAAVTVCKDNMFDLILLDVRMPVDGFQVYNMIKSVTKNAQTPVIFMAEATDLENISKAIKCGGRDILTKPFKVDELISKVTIHALLHIQNKRMNEFLEAKDKMLSIIAHDLRTPFNTLLGMSDLLMDTLKGSENISALRYSHQINNASIKTLELLDELLEYSRNLQNDALNILDVFDLSALIAEVLQEVQPVASIKNIHLTSVIDTTVHIHGIKSLISSMLRNFLSNAIKFSFEGGLVIVQTRVTADNVDIVITDKGIGMNDDTMNVLFDYSKKEVRTGTAGELGKGYGLLFSKEIIDKHSGVVKVQSKPNEGTVFTITFPLSTKS